MGLLKQGRQTVLRALLLQLRIGEAVYMKNEEWKAKRSPYEIATRLQKKMGWSITYGSGWLFKRTQ